MGIDILADVRTEDEARERVFEELAARSIRIHGGGNAIWQSEANPRGPNPHGDHGNTRNHVVDAIAVRMGGTATI
ncbi:hypothetical protein AB4144_66620, partial [Rhizobiaceae sp. 2RAB30]